MNMPHTHSPHRNSPSFFFFPPPRLWDIGTPGNSLAELRLPPDFVEGAPLAAFDSTGLVFGISAAMAGGEGYVSCATCCFSFFLPPREHPTPGILYRIPSYLGGVGIEHSFSSFSDIAVSLLSSPSAMAARTSVRCQELYRGAVLGDENDEAGHRGQDARRRDHPRARVRAQQGRVDVHGIQQVREADTRMHDGRRGAVAGRVRGQRPPRVPDRVRSDDIDGDDDDVVVVVFVPPVIVVPDGGVFHSRRQVGDMRQRRRVRGLLRCGVGIAREEDQGTSGSGGGGRGEPEIFAIRVRVHEHGRVDIMRN